MFAAVKRVARPVLRPIGEALWPAAEAFAKIDAQMRRPASVKWFQSWNAELDEALDELPAPPGCSKDQYRELMRPTSAQKLHALARENGAPSALISLRRRMRFWEPVSYQVLPSFIAPAASQPALGRALAVLGVEVHMPAGLDESVYELGGGEVGVYDAYQIDLTSDYESHWHKKSQRHLSTIRRARNKCAHLEHRIDGAGDMEWIVDTWRSQWLNDPGQEVSAAEDRVRFWSVLPRTAGEEWRVRTLQLTAGPDRVAGVVLLCRDGVATFQCWARDTAFDQLGAGNRALDLAIEIAAAEGYKCFDLGGGSVKHRWGPIGTQRYRVTFRPWILGMLRRVTPD